MKFGGNKGVAVWFRWNNFDYRANSTITVNAYNQDDAFTHDAVVWCDPGGVWHAHIRNVASGTVIEAMTFNTRADAKAWTETVLRML